MKKRFLAGLLVLVMILALLPVSAFAKEDHGWSTSSSIDWKQFYGYTASKYLVSTSDGTPAPTVYIGTSVATGTQWTSGTQKTIGDLQTYGITIDPPTGYYVAAVVITCNDEGGYNCQTAAKSNVTTFAPPNAASTAFTITPEAFTKANAADGVAVWHDGMGAPYHVMIMLGKCPSPVTVTYDDGILELTSTLISYPAGDGDKDGSVSGNVVTYTYEEGKDLPVHQVLDLTAAAASEAAAQGYVFAGWKLQYYSDAALNVPVTDAATVSIGQDVALYLYAKLIAQWEEAPATYTVSYDWGTENVPEGAVLPTDSNTYVEGQSYTVDDTYTSATVVFTYDTYGNVNGKYTFSGWNDPNSGVMGDSNVTITGSWSYEAMEVLTHTVSYDWGTENVPEGAVLPTDGNTYVKGQSYTVDKTYTSETEVLTYDAYGNVNGKYTFSGWSDPNGGVMGDSNVTITGSWSYEAMEVPTHTVSYDWGTENVPEDAVLPTDSNTYVKGQSYEVDTTYTYSTVVSAYDEDGTEVGIYSFSGWTDPNGGVMGDADVTITGRWTYRETVRSLTVEKLVSDVTPGVGDTITYWIKVTNTGDVDQKNVTVVDTLTGAAGSIDFTDTDNVTYENGVFTIKELTLNAPVVIEYTYTVLEDDAGRTIKNVAVAKGETDEVEVEVDNPDLNVEKTVDKTWANVGDKLTYTVTVTNTGNMVLENIEVVDIMTNASGSIDYEDTVGDNVVYSKGVFTILELKPGESETIEFTYTVKTGDSGKTIKNTAVASVENGPRDEDSSEGTKIISLAWVLPMLNTTDHVAYVIGYEDGTVRPNNNITRAEVATIFFRLLTDESRAYYWSQTNDYSDVDADDWFNNAVSTMSNAGIITGYPDGTFRPNEPITRAEFAAIAARFSDRIDVVGKSFSDVKDSHWAKKYISMAQGLGWITGYPDGTFKPDQSITRAEAMTLINRVLERAVENEYYMCPNMKTWSDNKPSDWFYEDVQEATNTHLYHRTSNLVPGQTFYYEIWDSIEKNPDWAALEKTWSKANTR